MPQTQLISWTRLVRYVSAKDGVIRYGEPSLSSDDLDITDAAEKGELNVTILEGQDPLSAKPTSETDSVKELLGPLEVKDVSIIRCIGLNYKSHSRRLPYHDM